MLSSHIYLVRCSLLCSPSQVFSLSKISARQVQAQGHGGLGEGFTGIAGRAVKVQTKLLIKTNKGQGPNKTLNQNKRPKLHLWQLVTNAG